MTVYNNINFSFIQRYVIDYLILDCAIFDFQYPNGINAPVGDVVCSQYIYAVVKSQKYIVLNFTEIGNVTATEAEIMSAIFASPVDSYFVHLSRYITLSNASLMQVNITINLIFNYSTS